MAAVVLSTSTVTVSGPFPMAPHQRIPVNGPIQTTVTATRSKQPSSSSIVSSQPSVAEPASKPFNRIRSSLEQSLRNATRSKKATGASGDFGALVDDTGKGKERAVSPTKEKAPGMLKRLESNFNFRRSGRDSITPSPSPIPPSPTPVKSKDKRVAGFTSFVTPSLRQASISSPALHLSSQPIPSPKSRSAIPASSSSISEAIASPTRERTSTKSGRSSGNAVAPSTPRRLDSRNGNATASDAKLQANRHRATKSQPINIPTSLSSTSLLSLDSPPLTPTTPTRANSGAISPPDTPTPMSRTRPRPAPMTSLSDNLRQPPPSPSQLSPRGISPLPTRSPSRRVVSPSHRGLTSSSTSHLPITPPSPSPTPRRPSLESPRRPSLDSPRRVSGESPRHGNIEARRPSGFGSRDESPSPVRRRPTSPAQRSYSQNRHFNISSGSLVYPSNSEHREAIRTATSMLLKEVIKPPPHMSRTESGLRDWEEVEYRTRALARLERIWGKSGANGSSVNLNNHEGISTNSGEERERRLFCEALRDGYVLCQLMNKIRSSSMVKPDPKEDGVIRTANVTKFLAACSSYGLPFEDLFQRDDLIEATGESLARVAHTIISLIKLVDTPIIERSKFLYGQSNKSTLRSASPSPAPHTAVYKGTSSRAASASSPNLLTNFVPQPVSASPPSPARKRWTPTALTTVRSDSPDENVGKTRAKVEAQEVQDGNADRDVVRIMSPPPKSPLRIRPPTKPPLTREDDGQGLFTSAVNSPPRSSIADSTRASVGDASVRGSITSERVSRHSTASALTDTSSATMMSSLLDVSRTTSAVFSKFGTIRTMTTDATSESPSSPLDGSFLADEMFRKRNDSLLNDRRGMDQPVVDLSRVIEESEEGGSTRGHDSDKGRSVKTEEPERVPDKPEKPHAIRLGKGKWPDDFIDALRPSSQPRPIPTKSPSPDIEIPLSSSPSSISPPRKLAIVGVKNRNESLEALPQFPRRPTHLARHSIDTPILLPKESGLRRDASPDGLSPTASSSRVMPRRNSTKPKNGGYVPRLDEARGSDNDNLVPFPRTASGELRAHSPSTRSSSGEDKPEERPRLARGRFQSDIEGSKRRPRPSSYDELGAKPSRSRYETMVNLGVASSNASASDLLSHSSIEGSAVRKTLVIREDGKPPTHFQLGNCIGRGQFGSVYRALNLNTGQMVAVKRIRLDGLKEEEVTTLMREVDLVRSLSHPSIVKYEGMARDDDTLSIVLEYAENGSLGQTLRAFGKLNERLVASYVVKILEGLHYLHTNDVVHCDLKAANILTTKNGNVKLSDFGVSLNMRAMEREIKDVAGTPNWMAPEVIELKGASPKSDIWSLACTVIELLTGKPPYADIANSMSVMFRIVEDSIPPIPEGCSPLLREFLTLCFNKDPAKRPNAEILFEHEWLRTNWVGHKELRPQDSIPFLRRVSADLQKSDAVRFLSNLDLPDTEKAEELTNGPGPARRRLSSSSATRPLVDSDISPRDHSFVKTTFSKPMICRVCLMSVKKSAVLCAQCSLISHAKCAPKAPPTCDLRAQLLLYAQYAEKGNPASAYSNPAAETAQSEAYPRSPMSDVSYVAHTPRTSLDTAPPPPPPPQSPQPGSAPPTSFKFMHAFKKSRNLPTPEPNSSSTSLLPQVPHEPKPRAVLHRRVTKERPQSVSSNSTQATSSMRSRETAAPSTGRRSVASTDPARTVSFSAIAESEPMHDVDDGELPGAFVVADARRHRKAKSANNCIVQ